MNAATVNLQGERTGGLAVGDPCEVDLSEPDYDFFSAEPSLFGSIRLDSIRLIRSVWI